MWQEDKEEHKGKGFRVGSDANHDIRQRDLDDEESTRELTERGRDTDAEVDGGKNRERRNAKWRDSGDGQYGEGF